MERDVVFPHSATLFAAICACIFVVIGVLGNLITILALLKCPKMRGHATTAFVLSLCISDLLFCSFSLPLTAVRYFQEAWTLGDTLCKIFPVIFYGNVAVSLLSMVGITLNRYILIACHRLYSQIYSPTCIVFQLVFVWAFSFLMLLPPLLGIWGEMGLDKATFSCTILKKDGKSIKKTLFLFGILLPCIIITVSYLCIYFKVRKQKQKMKAHRSFQKPSKESISAARKSRDDNRLSVMMVTIFVCFIACFLPLMLANVIDEHNNSHPWFHIIASVMAWASSVINPFIYAASNRNYRVAYFKVFALLKFWGEPLSPMPSKSYQPSKISRDASGGMRSTPLFHEVRTTNSDNNILCQPNSI